MGGQPRLAGRIQVVAGAVVDDQKDFAPSVFRHQALEKCQERAGVEHLGELEGELCRIQANRRKQMSGLARAKRVDARLAADSRPRAVQCAVEPEARFVFEQDYPAARSGFF